MVLGPPCWGDAYNVAGLLLPAGGCGPLHLGAARNVACLLLLAYVYGPSHLGILLQHSWLTAICLWL